MLIHKSSILQYYILLFYILMNCVCSGFNPVWYDTLRFTIHAPELALVRFVVEDYDKASRNDFVGQYTLPFSCIQQGKAHPCI